MTTAILLLHLFCHLAMGSDAAVTTPLDYGGYKILSPADDFHVLTQGIERGFPILRNVGEGTKKVTPDDDASDYNKIMVISRKRLDDNLVIYRQNLKDSFTLRQERHKDEKPVEEDPKSMPESPLLKVGLFSKESASKFCICANNALAVLKMKQRYVGVDHALEVAELEGLLVGERGNGSLVSPDGIACGIYLGEYGIRAGTELSEIQILSTLSKPTTQDESESIFRYYALFSATMRANKLEIPLFWKFAWKKVSFYRVMTTTQLPLPGALIDAFVELRKFEIKDGKNNSVSFVIDRSEVEKKITRDWQAVKLPEN